MSHRPATSPTNYPDNDGFAETPAVVVLAPGTRLWRWGSPSGTYATDPGTSPQECALPPSNPGSPHPQTGEPGEPPVEYEVVVPIEQVLKGTCAPAPDWGHPGGGMQYKLSHSFHQLEAEGFLRKVS